MSIVQNMVGGSSSKCILTVKNCGANATVTATSDSATLTATADANGDAVFTLTKKDTYTISSTMSKGITEFLFYAQTEAEVWLHTLPNEYQEVEFLQSTGTQYIDTGYVPNLTTKIEIDEQFTSISSNVSGYNGRMGAAKNNTVRFLWTIFSTYIGVQVLSDTLVSVNIPNGLNRHLLTIDAPNRIAKVNGVSASITNTFALQQYPIILFAATTTDSVGYIKSSAKIYSVKLYENETLVTSLIPCYRISDSVAGMYDMVNDVFYTNAGSGTFIVGQDILYPDDFQEVEYLQGTGTQRIDTDVVGNVNIGIKAKYKFQNAVNGPILCGTDTTNQVAEAFNIPRLDGGNTTAMRPWGTVITLKQGIDTDIHVVELNPSTGEVKFDGVSKGNLSMNGYATSKHIFLFGNSTAASIATIFNFEIMDVQNTIRLFIPVFRKRDNKPGMWDSVSHKFFINAGTGEFIVGRMVI